MTETARLAQLLASRLQALWGTAAEITGIQRLSGGASRESWGVQARMTDGAERRLILLRDPGRSDRAPGRGRRGGSHGRGESGRRPGARAL